MSTKSSINVGGLEFQWELEKGQFKFEGQDSRSFLDFNSNENVLRYHRRNIRRRSFRIGI